MVTPRYEWNILEPLLPVMPAAQSYSAPEFNCRVPAASCAPFVSNSTAASKRRPIALEWSLGALHRLPRDVWWLILARVSSARDACSFAQSCRGTWARRWFCAFCASRRSFTVVRGRPSAFRIFLHRAPPEPVWRHLAILNAAHWQRAVFPELTEAQALALTHEWLCPSEVSLCQLMRTASGDIAVQIDWKRIAQQPAEARQGVRLAAILYQLHREMRLRAAQLAERVGWELANPPDF